MKKFVLLFLSIIYSFVLVAQEQNPPSILWKIIETPNFRIIFPSEIEAEAQRVANTMETVVQYDTSSLLTHPKKVSLVLNNRAMISNAYAALAPRYMQFYMKPPQEVTSLGSMDWMQLLAIHEYRHIVQYSKNKTAFTKFFSWLYGDMGQLAMQYSIPYWFFEGDAVIMETALTKGGRGRIPAFAMPMRTYALNNINFKYDRAYLGTYRTFYPSWYHLGYFLTAYGRNHYGKNIWDKVLEHTSKISFWPYAFSLGLKKFTGLNVNNFYKAAMLELDSVWTSRTEKQQYSPVEILNNTKKRSFTNYFNPQFDEDGNIIVVKQDLDEISTFYKIMPDGKEKKIKVTDADLFKVQGKFAVWSRYIPDVRWGQQSFTDIVILNLNTQKELTLTKKGKYLAPAISPDGKTIVAVKFDEKQQCRLVLLHSGSGKELASYTVGNNDYVRTPSWSPDSKKIVFTHAKYRGPAVSILDISSGNISKIIDYSFENIGRPVFYQDYILYHSNFSGIENIYAVNIFNKKRYQVVSSKYGAFNANISGKNHRIIFQEYSANGYNIGQMELLPEKWKPIDDIRQANLVYTDTLVNQEAGKNIFAQTDNFKEYPVSEKKYRSGLKLHSWGIYPYLSLLDIGFMADNYLKTMSLSGGYLYNINENTHGAYLRTSYSKYYPVLSLSGIFMQNNRTYNFSDGSSEYLEWDEYSVNLDVSVPFNFSRGVYYRNAKIGVGANFKYIDNKPIRTIDETYSGTFTPLYISAKLSNIRQYAYRDIAPKYGQLFALDYYQIFDYDDYEGYLFSARTAFYFPGIFPNNSIRIGAAYEKQITFDPNNYQQTYYFSSLVNMPRGYDSEVLDKMYKLSFDYKSPVLYPDISVGPLFYVNRITAGAFFDYAKAYLATANANYASLGGSLNFRFKFFRIHFPVDIGIQYARLINERTNRFSFMIAGMPL